MSLTQEERQRLRERRSEIMRARFQREQRFNEAERRREHGHTGIAAGHARSCAGCAGLLHNYTFDCDHCQERFYRRVMRGTETLTAYRDYMDERRQFYRYAGDRLTGRLPAVPT